MNSPLAYTYEADYHCESCAAERFGYDDEGHIVGIDSEGNMIGVIFPWDEWWANDAHEGNSRAVLACGTCLDVIETMELTS